MVQEIYSFNEITARMALLSTESSTYERLAYYFEKNYLEIIFMTASEVASKVRVSQGSVSRFCSALGYCGYTDLVRNLQRIVSQEITAPQRLKFSSEKSETKSKLRDIASKESLNLSEIENVIHSEEYKNMVNSLVASKTVLLLSAKMSATLIPYTAYIMNKIRNDVFEVTPNTRLWDNVVLRNPDENVIFAIGFPRYPMVLIEKLTELKKLGFTIFAITDSNLSPICKLADKSFIIPITVSSIFDIYSTPMIFINLLCKDMAKKISSLDNRLELIESYDKQRKVYYKL